MDDEEDDVDHQNFDPGPPVLGGDQSVGRGIVNFGASTSAANSISTETTVRVRQYHDSCVMNVYTVFVRERVGEGRVKIAPVKIATYINAKYKSVKLIKHNHDRIRVVFTERADANALCHDEFFRFYVVSIPADLVEIVGAISYSDLCDINDVAEIKRLGKGRFSNPLLPPCAILDAQLLTRKSSPSNTPTSSDTIKVTFAGRVLPKYVLFEGLIVHVRQFFQKPMFCDRCQLFGHTDKFCKRNPKCAHCAGAHMTTECSDSRAQSTLCCYCLTSHDGGRTNCSYFQEVTDSYRQKQNNQRKSRLSQAVSAVRAHVHQQLPQTQQQQCLQQQHQQQQHPTQRQQSKQMFPGNLSNSAEFPAIHNRYETLATQDEPLPNCSRNAATTAPSVPPPAKPFPPPPNNIYARHRTTTRSEQIQRSASKRRRDNSIVSSAMPNKTNHSHTSSQSHPSPQYQLPTWPSNPIATGSRQTKPTEIRSFAASIKALILAKVHDAGLSPIMASIIEAVVDPLLDAVIPLIPDLISCFVPTAPNRCPLQ